MAQNYVYRQSPTSRPQYYRPKRYQDETLSWLYSRATQQYVVANIVGPLSTESLFYGQTPDVATGDILVVPLVTPDGYTITPGSDGVLIIQSGGVLTRQAITYDIYDSSLSAFYGSATAYINNQAPVFTDTPVVIAVERNQSITPVDMSGNATDAEGDALTWTRSTSAPGSIALSSIGVWSGVSPDANSITTQSGLVTDIAGDTDTWSVTLIVGNVTVPDVSLQSLGAATTLINNAYLTIATGVAVNSATVPVGAVAAQSPAVGNEVAPFSTVTVQLSLGPAGAVSVLLPLTNLTFAQNTGVHTLNLATYISGATTYTCPQTFTNGETLVAATFSMLSTHAGTFGPFKFTGSAGTPSATLNEFTYTVTPTAAAANPVRAIRFTTSGGSIQFSVS